MSKILGHINNANETGWFTSSLYGVGIIDDIIDPAGDKSLILPTAIPSPFARIDLVKNAFVKISKSQYLKEQTGKASKQDEKLVSDCLDLAELMFNYDSVPNLEIVFWDKNTQIQALKTSGNVAHRRLAETLEMFLNQDADTYNFNELDGFYLMKHNHKVIGGTSPVSMFFTSGNDLTSAQTKLKGNDTLFDDNYTPLYERDVHFQKYLYLLFEANPVLKATMKCFGDYLEANKVVLQNQNNTLWSEIQKLDVNCFHTDYLDLNFGANKVMLFGVNLKKRDTKEDINFVKNNSDFRIKAPKFKADILPLVLANDSNSLTNLLYVQEKWNKDFKVPANEQTPFEKRKLPGIALDYPYLAIDDFLEEYLIQMPYPLDNESYFDGNLKHTKGGENKSYLLPLKTRFFDFFNAEDLYANNANSPKLTMDQGSNNSVKVTLKIPVQGQYVEFSRIYQHNAIKEDTGAIETPNLNINEGKLFFHSFSIALFPFIKAKTPNVAPFYRVQLIDLDNAGPIKQSDYTLKFYDNTSTSKLNIEKPKRRLDDKNVAVSEYSVIDKEFDYIQVNTGIDDAEGIIIPKWPKYNQGPEEFTFAVDFGTTNTHIEYETLSNTQPKAFQIGQTDKQVASLIKGDYSQLRDKSALRTLIDIEFMPAKIGNDSPFQFPIRTAITSTKGLSSDSNTHTLADFNIGFSYFIDPLVAYKTDTNLKWSQQDGLNTKKIETFIESIIILMRNKVLLNGGNLNKTKLVWFYPSSMSPKRIDDLADLWNKYFNKYIQRDVESKRLMESLAPFYYFKDTETIKGASQPVATIDIGGGTTDVVVFVNGIPICVTSFMFASNNLFGNGYVGTPLPKSNGFVKKYFAQFETKIKETNNGQLEDILSSLNNKGDEEVNNFLLTIDADKNKIQGYASTLAKDEDFKIGFLYYFSAIVTHVASLMKSKGVDIPKYVLFSGTGSKVLNIIATRDERLSELAIAIFKKVYNQTIESDAMEVIRNKEVPKELTCKGGLIAVRNEVNIDADKLKNKDFITFGELNDTIFNSVIEDVKAFNDMFITVSKEVDFEEKFGTSKKSMEIFEQEINKDLNDYLKNGIDYSKKLDKQSDTDKLKETMFFYPITGALQNLLSKLSTINPIS